MCMQDQYAFTIYMQDQQVYLDKSSTSPYTNGRLSYIMTWTHTLVTNHQRRPNNDRFTLSKKPVENRQHTNLCKSNLSAIHAEGSRTKNLTY